MQQIDELLNCLGIKAGTFAKSIGVHPTQIYDLQSGKTKSITPAMAEKIIQAYPQVSRLWLLTREGDICKTCNSGELQEPQRSQHKEADSYRLVPLINIDSVGGIHSQNQIATTEQYVMKMMPFSEAREGDVAILQTGNSMYPTIPPGSVLLIREVEDWQEYFGYGGIYVIWLRDGRRITKEVRRYDADPKNYVWCVSYNPDVADEELPRSMIRGVWKVVKYLADFGW